MVQAAARTLGLHMVLLRQFEPFCVIPSIQCKTTNHNAEASVHNTMALLLKGSSTAVLSADPFTQSSLFFEQRKVDTSTDNCRKITSG
jgi:hypothetical protein